MGKFADMVLSQKNDFRLAIGENREVDIDKEVGNGEEALQ